MCRLGNYLVVLFLISKIFYIGNAVGQLFLLDLVLATKYHTLGFDVTSNLARQRDWTEESYVAFPRVTLCDFKVLLLRRLCDTVCPSVCPFVVCRLANLKSYRRILTKFCGEVGHGPLEEKLIRFW